MKKFLLFNLALFFAATPFLVSQTSESSPPTIPEEARRHFVIGATLFKDAKTNEDFAMVQSEFKQAVDLAPQWPEARYNLALSKDAAGDYAGAMADLKTYLQFQLPDAEARKAQDKIYVIEAKQKKAEGAANEQARAAAQQAAVYEGLDGGVWLLYGIGHDSDRPLHEAENTRVFIEVHGHQINMYDTDDMNTGMKYETWNITFTQRQFHAAVKPGGGMSSNVTISGNGQSILLVNEDGPEWFFHRIR
jgi:tetratricopeptide (TPR) repeat protein